jgi:hypothetical protein
MLSLNKSVVLFIASRKNAIEIARQLNIEYDSDNIKKHITSFQNNTSRIIIVKASQIDGIDLGDKHGSYPRISLISPAIYFYYYGTNVIMQAAGRTTRHNVRSKSEFYTINIYCDHVTANKFNFDIKFIEYYENRQKTLHNFVQELQKFAISCPLDNKKQESDKEAAKEDKEDKEDKDNEHNMFYLTSECLWNQIKSVSAEEIYKLYKS